MLTKEAAKSLLAYIIAQNPDTVNPSTENGCVYWQENNDGVISRCIIGQLGHTLGWPTPEPIDGGVSDLFDTSTYDNVPGIWNGLATDRCVKYLQQVQREADGNANLYGQPLPWGEITL